MDYYNDMHYGYSPEIKFICTKNYTTLSIISRIVEIFSKTHLDIINNDIRKCIASWNDWLSGSPGNLFSNIYSSSITLNQNTHVLFCVFLNINSSIALISGASINISLLVEECTFFDCYIDGNGGAIYFNDGLDCVLSKICAYQCNATSSKYGQFCFIKVRSGSQYKNIAHLVSVGKCAQYEKSGRYCSIRFENGNISLNNINSSANRCKYYSGVCFASPSISYTTQSTFSNNTDDNFICIYFLHNSHQISQCNIIENHQKTTTFGTIINDGYATTTLSGCVIDMNTGVTNIIYAESGSSVTLQNCYLQSNMKTIGNINIQSPLSESHSLTLIHFNSQICLTLMQNVIDDVNTLTSNIKYLIDTNMFNIQIILTLLMMISIQF